MTTTFAERLRWARYNGPAARKSGKVVGATILSRKAGCAQSLISSLERNNAKGSDHNNKFAEALGIDQHWLATGDGRAPEGFDEDKAHDMLKFGGERLLTLVHSAPKGSHGGQPEPRWSQPRAEPNQAAQLQKSLMADFMTFAELVGSAKAEAFLDLLQHYTKNVLTEGAARENHT
jgi:hypothetical protein